MCRLRLDYKICVVSALVFLTMELLRSSHKKTLYVGNNPKYKFIIPWCNVSFSQLKGELKITENLPNTAEMNEIRSGLSVGGHYKPLSCKSRNKVAIIIPFRNRDHHLKILTSNLIPILKRQQLEFRIFVIEQGGYKSESYNKASLFNAGYLEARQKSKWDCYIFHDVDEIPENDRNSYDCSDTPRHLSVAIDQFNYAMPYKTFFGGVFAMTEDQILQINGFANMYWGWGGEDDDIAGRLAHHSLTVTRVSPKIGRYTMLKHKHSIPNSERFEILDRSRERYRNDGLNNINYLVEQVRFENTHTLIRVKLQKMGWKLANNLTRSKV